MKNGRRSEARASAASYNKRQPRHCSRSASRRLARGCPQRKPKRKLSTKTINENEKPKRKPKTKTVLVLVARSRCSFWFSLAVALARACRYSSHLLLLGYFLKPDQLPFPRPCGRAPQGAFRVDGGEVRPVVRRARQVCAQLDSLRGARGGGLQRRRIGRLSLQGLLDRARARHLGREAGEGHAR